MLDLPLHIDSTMRTAFVGCGQKFNLEFAHGFRPKQKSIHLHAGGCFATGLEAVYKSIYLDGRSFDDSIIRGHAAFMQSWGNFDIPDWKSTAKTKDRMWEAIAGAGSYENKPSDPDNRGYFEVYSPLTDEIKPFFDSQGKPTFEYTFAIPLEPASDVLNDWLKRGCPTCEGSGRTDDNTPCSICGGTGEEYGRTFPLHPSGAPFLYCGRFDQLGSYRGRTVVKDDKTMSVTPPNNWAESYDLRSQFIGYVWACQQAGLDVDSVLVRGIGILKTKIAHQEVEKTYDKFIIARWYEQLRRDLWRIRRSYDEGYWDFDLGEQCNSYGGCMFRHVCASANPEAWLQEFQISRWNPLDKDPSKAEAKNG